MKQSVKLTLLVLALALTCALMAGCSENGTVATLETTVPTVHVPSPVLGGQQVTEGLAALTEATEAEPDPAATEAPDPDRDDWGVSFEVLEAAPTHLTVRCTQSGGENTGRLRLGEGLVRGSFFMEDPYVDPSEEVFIENSGVTEFTIPWPEAWGPLPAGEYVYEFYLRDTYKDMPESMQDDAKQQEYSIPFTIEE